MVHDFGGRKICLKGIGKMFDQEGLPIQISITELGKKGIEVSMYHVADELLKLGWNSKTVSSRLSEDYKENNSSISLQELTTFIYSTYEEQREMIFQYLFGYTSKEVIENKEKRDLLTQKIGLK